ncbi:hypothetical protein J7E38_10025 [Bacillus sp. ISL-35]|uniref:hypothetical protein n=1 Tax=Bacillus sp. ISL-35 TaxID=2819122 RepID=UPI001BEB6C1F|nr:hypothetical protein [Bacillus sp. ISL-35]MBT2703239.1 hypothetical protein [Chryseobacterium sp. ISL-80]
MEEILKQILNEIKDMRVDIKDLRQGQNRLEIGQEKLQKTLFDSIGLNIDKIVEHIDDKTEALNKRVYKVETEIERLSRQ